MCISSFTVYVQVYVSGIFHCKCSHTCEVFVKVLAINCEIEVEILHLTTLHVRILCSHVLCFGGDIRMEDHNRYCWLLCTSHDTVRTV